MPSRKRRKQARVLLTHPCRKATKVKCHKTVKTVVVKKKTVVPTSSSRKKVKLPGTMTWDQARDYFMRYFSAEDVNVIANEIVRGMSYEDACKKHGKNLGSYNVYFNFLYARGGLLWLGSGQRIYQRLKSAVGRKNENLKNKAKKRTIQDITNKLLDAHKTEQRLQKQVVDKDKLIVKVNSMYTSCRKQMVKQRKKAKSKQDEIQEKDQVGVHTCTCQHTLIIHHTV